MCSLLLIVAAVVPATAAPRGRVVRIERSQARTAPPRVCVAMDTPEKLMCVGEPRPGDAVAFVDQQTGEQLGAARIASSAPARMGVCAGKPAPLFDAAATLIAGTTDQLSRTRTVALRGITLDTHARGVPTYQVPQERLDQRLIVALDTDGDARVDLTMYNYTCDATGAPATTGPRAGDRLCFDTYQDRTGRLVRTHQDVIELCY